MIGIDIDNLDKLIKLNNMSVDEITKYIKNIIFSITELDECYTGKDLDFVFSELMIQRSNINKIPSLISNYSTVLSSVKQSYKMQDDNVHSIMNHHKI